MAITKFNAKHATLAYSTAAVTYDTGTELYNESFTANEQTVKDLTVTIPEMAYDQIKLFGATAQTIGANAQTVGTATGVTPGKFQNAAMEVTAVGQYKVSGTLVFTGNEQGPDLLGLDVTTGTAINSTATRYGVGGLTSSNAFDRVFLGAYRIYFNNGSERVTVVLTNAYTKIGDITLTGTDGHWERSFEAMCLPKDGAIEFID